MNAFTCQSLSDAFHTCQSYDIIGIDEGQFFPNIETFADMLASLGKVVIIAILDATYERKPFPCVGPLVAASEKVIKLKAVCMRCYGDASFTERVNVESSGILEEETQADKIETKSAIPIEIGGAEKYRAVCRACYQASNTANDKKSSIPSVIMSATPSAVAGVAGVATSNDAQNHKRKRIDLNNKE